MEQKPLYHGNYPKLINYLSAFAICLSPIFAPYRLLGPISIGFAFILVMAILCIINSKKIVTHVPLLLLVTIHSLLSLIAYFTTMYNEGVEAILWNVIIIFIRSLAFIQIVPYFEIKSFFRVCIVISSICGGFLIYQLLCINMGVDPPTGKLFENMTSGYAWSYSTKYLRPNSLFSEPSYFAIFLLPAMALMFIYKKKILGILCGLLLFLSTSTLGIVGGALILIAYTFISKQFKNLIIIACGIIFVVIIYVNVFDVEWLLKNNLSKIANSYDDSWLRIRGYIDYFWMLPVINSIIGVGSGQLANFFWEYGIPNYSNAFVIILMNFGMVGFLTFLFFIRSLYLKSTIDGKVFLLILLLICSVDAFIYSENFFYVIFYVLVFSKGSYFTIHFVNKKQKSLKKLLN